MGTQDQQKENLQQLFGQVLRQHRLDNGISQEKLALECDLDRTYISLLERGLRTPTLWTVFVIAEQLNIPPHKLVRDVEQQTS